MQILEQLKELLESKDYGHVPKLERALALIDKALEKKPSGGKARDSIQKQDKTKAKLTL